jgi:Protein of unknown function (DUF1573)
VKARYVLIAGALVGTALGIGSTWADFGRPPQLASPRPDQGFEIDAQALPPKLVVDQTLHDFGVIDRGAKVSHAFRFTNVGKGMLRLKAGPTTCTACTISSLSKSQVAPGETADVVVEYLPNAPKPDFKQIATVLTNDPEQPRVELNIRGNVSRRFLVLPDRLVMSNVSAKEPHTAEAKIFCFLSDEVKVVSHEFTGALTAPFFEVKTETIPKDELSKPNAKSGCRVLVTLKPGLPLGPFQQTIRLTIDDADEQSEMDLRIEGTVVSDLSIVGPGWRRDTGILTIGSVDRAKGAVRKLSLLVRGAARHDVTIEPVELDPPWLKVTLGEPTELNESVIRIPLAIEIPPGRPPAIYLGTDQGKYGEIRLGVKNHPDVKEIRMRLKFVIGNGN